MSEHAPNIVLRNIRAIVEARQRDAAKRTRTQRVADSITQFTGSVALMIVHASLFVIWIAMNSAILPIHPWDPFPFPILAMLASVEAIFLSIFVLMGQRRMTQIADQRAELDLQINLLAEHEITHVLELVDAIAKRLGIQHRKPEEVESLKQEVSPSALLAEIDVK